MKRSVVNRILGLGYLAILLLGSAAAANSACPTQDCCTLPTSLQAVEPATGCCRAASPAVRLEAPAPACECGLESTREPAAATILSAPTQGASWLALPIRESAVLAPAEDAVVALAARDDPPPTRLATLGLVGLRAPPQ